MHMSAVPPILIFQISVDHSGEFVASCSAAEGKVMVSGLYTKENNHSMTMGAAVSAITLDPIYARPGSGRRFMTGIAVVLVNHYRKKSFIKSIEVTSSYYLFRRRSGDIARENLLLKIQTGNF
jgi:hypothetical protein